MEELTASPFFLFYNNLENTKFCCIINVEQFKIYNYGKDFFR